jgi:predicted XRE-type DNA-binding protein
MLKREDLLKSSEYWTEIIQNKIFNDLMEYIEDNNISNKQLGEILGLSKGRISQILSGKNLNFKIDSLVKLCLSINKVPDFQLVDLMTFIEKDLNSSVSTVFHESKYIQSHSNEMLKYNPDKPYENVNLPLDLMTMLFTKITDEGNIKSGLIAA